MQIGYHMYQGKDKVKKGRDMEANQNTLYDISVHTIQ